MSTARHQVASKSVLERVFAVLDCFSAEEPELTLAELASRTAIPKSTVHRLAKVLVEQRLLKRTDAGFGLGIRLFELGELVGERRDLRDASLPFLEELFEQRSRSAGRPCGFGRCSEHHLCAAPRPRSPSESAVRCRRAGADPA